MPKLPRNPPRSRTLNFAKIATAMALLVLAGSTCTALAGPSATPTPRSGTYLGLLGVNSISFKVSADHTKINGLTTSFDAAADALDCSIPPSSNTVHETFPTLTIHDGHFSGSLTVDGGATATYSIQGQFISATKATGTISGHLKVKSLPPCDAESTFSAKRKGK